MGSSIFVNSGIIWHHCYILREAEGTDAVIFSCQSKEMMRVLDREDSSINLEFLDVITVNPMGISTRHELQI
jgi:hypothetical protein